MVMLNVLVFISMFIEKLVLEHMLDQTTILEELHVPLRLNMM